MFINFLFSINAQHGLSPEITEGQCVLRGDKCSWDADAVHTISIVEVNHDGYKYWGYCGLNHYQNDQQFLPFLLQWDRAFSK